MMLRVRCPVIHPLQTHSVSNGVVTIKYANPIASIPKQCHGVHVCLYHFNWAVALYAIPRRLSDQASLL